MCIFGNVNITLIKHLTTILVANVVEFNGNYHYSFKVTKYKTSKLDRQHINTLTFADSYRRHASFAFTQNRLKGAYFLKLYVVIRS